MLLSECVGGRVDGDKYFVSCDQGIIPQFLSSPPVGFAQTTSSWTKQMNLKCFKEKKPSSEEEQRKRFQKAHMEIIVHFCEF